MLKTTFQNKFLFLQNSRFFPYVYIDFKRTLPRQEGKKRGKKRVKMPPIQYPSQENPDAAKLVAHCKFWNPICEPPICNPKTLHHLRPKPKEENMRSRDGCDYAIFTMLVIRHKTAKDCTGGCDYASLTMLIEHDHHPRLHELVRQAPIRNIEPKNCTIAASC